MFGARDVGEEQKTLCLELFQEGFNSNNTNPRKLSENVAVGHLHISLIFLSPFKDDLNPLKNQTKTQRWMLPKHRAEFHKRRAVAGGLRID